RGPVLFCELLLQPCHTVFDFGGRKEGPRRIAQLSYGAGGARYKETGHVSDDQGGQQAFEIRDWRVTALMNRCAEAPEESIFRDKNSPCYKLFPGGSTLL